jgi:hypothetical protein
MVACPSGSISRKIFYKTPGISISGFSLRLRFYAPYGIGIQKAMRVLMSTIACNSIRIRKITLAGLKFAVTENCGYKVAVYSPKRMAEAIADIVVTIDRNWKIILEKRPRTSQRVATHFTEEHYQQTINPVYKTLARLNGVTRQIRFHQTPVGFGTGNSTRRLGLCFV